MTDSKETEEIKRFIKDMDKFDIYISYVQEYELRLRLNEALNLSQRENARLRNLLEQQTITQLQSKDK